MPKNINNLAADIIVVGGGPAGMMAAGRAAELDAKVLLVEKTKQLGTKLLLTGGDRCNITNTADFKEFSGALGKNGKFLYRAWHVFSNRDLIDFFSARGLAIEVDSDSKATGGKSYPKTGSTGDGYKLTEQCGHTIVPLKPGLIPLESDEKFVPELQGLTLKHILISIVIDGKARASA
ncbi:MAG: NAD(P)/FAD-dependent oxidoreductase [Elusimicrobia bacterium]|nr:NAD(P)/FAD-dependent oxidoreductase [Elusimicrobiota bacterium]